MRPTVVSPAAAIHLDEQANYLATRASLATALRFYEAAAETFAALARHFLLDDALTHSKLLVRLVKLH